MNSSKKNILGLLFSLLIITSCSNKIQLEKAKPEGTAVVIIGAASRFSQETALLERLYNEGELKDVQLIAGVSAGALNAVVLNGVLEKKINFNEVRSILYSLKESDIYINPDHKLPVDLSPFKNTLKRIYNDSIGYSSIQEITIPTIISTVDKKHHQLVRLSNIEGYRDEDKITNDIVNCLLSTSAMPHVFPSTLINNQEYIDGGTIEDIPINAVLEYELYRKKPFKKIILIGIQRNKITEWNTEIDLLDVHDFEMTVIKNVLTDFHYNMDKKDILKDKMKKFYKDYPSVTNRVFVYSPIIENFEYVPILGFYDQKYQYEAVYEWAENNKPLILSSYLRQ